MNHPRDPLHGITLETILTQLQAQYGWQEMADRIPVRCFQFDPSINLKTAVDPVFEAEK